MKRATRNAAKTKQAIIEKSAPVFNVNGYAGTSMQMLVEASGYQMGGIYRHFDTKMDLAQAVFKYNYETIIKPNLEFETSLNSKEKLLKIIENYKKMILNPHALGGCPILNTATEMDDTNEAFRVLTKSFVEEILSTIESLLEEGKTAGLFRITIDAKQEALYLFATFEGAILIGKITRRTPAFFDVFEKIVKYLEQCVFVRD